ncbi:very-long-chain 3-oxoacyl-CoA synthase [Trifolium repens]|nr:very-long-chain 3-oxoacyl-CoA synthase [Trifolium repens]
MDDIQYRETFFNVNSKQWLNINMNMKLGFDGMKQWTEYWATTCLCLWYWRNKMMHESDGVMLTLPWLDVMRRVPLYDHVASRKPVN